MNPKRQSSQVKRSPGRVSGGRVRNPDGLGTPEPPEPRVAREFYTPIWFVTAFALLLYWGGLYVDSYGGRFNPQVYNRGDTFADVEARAPKSEADALFTRGRQVYTMFCAACHQPSGLGVAGQFPPLVGSEWVIGVGPNRLIKIVLNGLEGPITVKGQSYNNLMLGWRDQLSDDDVAAVLTFIRGNKDWSHADPGVSSAKVTGIRAATADRTTYWTADELLALPDSD